MNTSTTFYTPQTQRLYVVSMLIDLRYWGDELRRNEQICTSEKAKDKQKDPTYDVDAHYEALDKCDKLREQEKTWWNDFNEYFKSSGKDLAANMEELLGGKRKRKIKQEPQTQEQQMLRWGDMVAGKLWGPGGQLGGWADKYLTLLADYMCADYPAKNPAFDKMIIEKLTHLNEVLKRSIDYKSAQALLLEKLDERKRKSPGLDLDAILERYMSSVSQGSTFGADNHLFRCMAAGCFYLPGKQFSSAQYSDYFVQHYGNVYNIKSKKKTKSENTPPSLNVNDMLDIIQGTYGADVKEKVKRKLKSSGLSESDFPYMNSFDAARVLQKEWNAANQNGKPTYLRDICRDEDIVSPYQKQAQKVGLMLAVGHLFAQELDKGKTINEAAKALEFKAVKTDHLTVLPRVWKNYFQEQYSDYKDFATECTKVYRSVSSDFQKNGFGAYYDKWVEALCQRGDYNPNFEGINKPFEINMHHKVPVKMAAQLDPKTDINDGRNFLLFVEFKAPDKEKLTKHQQEHAKESNSTAAIDIEPDARFYVSSGGRVLSYSQFQEPQSITALRAKEREKREKQENASAGAVQTNVAAKERDGR